MIKTGLKPRKSICIGLILLLLIPVLNTISGSPAEEKHTAYPERSTGDTWNTTKIIQREFELPPGERYYVYFDNVTGDLVEESFDYLEEALPQSARDAVARMPAWLQKNLTRKFLELDFNTAHKYGQLIVGVNDERYLDEVGFSIAHTSTRMLQSNRVIPEVFVTNAQYIYENDPHLDYVDIVEIDDRYVGSYTTLNYINQTGVQIQLPMELYYWFVVHPKLSDEYPSFVNPDGIQGSPNEFEQPPVGKFWRDWLFYHNDTGYPLLKESVQNCSNVWEAVAAVSGWVVGSMAFTSDNERAVEPVRIYRKHIGRCGEHQDMACAAARAALIPTVCTSNMAEDHVWNEFWDGRWVHWDANSYNNVDHPLGQDKDYHGGKDISTIWSWRGDGKTWSVTEKYTPVCTYTANAVDSNGNPVDGAEIMVCTEFYYDHNQLTMTTYGCTDAQGQVEIPLGNVRNYWSSADSALGEDPADQGGGERVTQVITGAQTDQSYSHTFHLPSALPTPDYTIERTNPAISDDIQMDISYRVTESVHIGTSMLTREKYFDRELNDNTVDAFIVNATQFENYTLGNPFKAMKANENGNYENMTHMTSMKDRCFLVLSNEDKVSTIKRVNITIELKKRHNTCILSPSEGDDFLLNTPIVIRGSSISSRDIEGVEISFIDDIWHPAQDITPAGTPDWLNWEYVWQAADYAPGSYNIKVRSYDDHTESISSINITLIDDIPPILQISTPDNLSVFRIGEVILFSGLLAENDIIESMTIEIGNSDPVEIPFDVNNTNWSYVWNTLNENPGTYTVSVEASDRGGNLVKLGLEIELVEGNPPVITFTDPENGSFFKGSEELELEGDYSDISGVVKIEVAIDGDLAGPFSVTRFSPDKGWFLDLELDELDLPEGVQNITVTAWDLHGNVGTANLTILIDMTEPQVMITDPINNSRMDAGTGFIDFNFTLSEEYSLEQIIMIVDNYHSLDLTGSIDELSELQHYKLAIENITVLDLSSGWHSFMISARDMAGHWGHSQRFDILLDSNYPALEIEEETKKIFMVGDIIWINGTSEDDNLGSSLYYYIAGGNPKDLIDISSYIEGTDWSISIDTSDLEAGDLELVFRTVDILDKWTESNISFELIDGNTDSDLDGMPDWWEIKFGLQRDVDDAEDDKDNDGTSNLYEYLGADGTPGNNDWTDPSDRRSYPLPESKESETSDSNFLIWIILGVIILVFLLLIAFILVMKRRSKEGEEDLDGEFDDDYQFAPEQQYPPAESDLPSIMDHGPVIKESNLEGTQTIPPAEAQADNLGQNEKRDVAGSNMEEDTLSSPDPSGNKTAPPIAPKPPTTPALPKAPSAKRTPPPPPN